MGGLARGGLANFAGAWFTGTAGIGAAWLVTRSLGPAAAGILFTAVAVFGMVAGAAQLGTPTGLAHWLARLRAQGRDDMLAPCLRAGITPVSVVALAAAMTLWLAAPWLDRMLPGAAGGATTAVRTLAAFLPVVALTDTLLAATRGYRLMRPTILLDKVLRPGLQLVGLGLLTLATLWTAVPAAAWPLAWAVPYLPVLPLAAYALARLPSYYAASSGPAGGGGTGPGGGYDEGIGVAFWRFTAPRAVAGVPHVALQGLDIVLVAAIVGPTAAAGYAVAGRLVVLGQLVNQAVGTTIRPRLAERLGTGDRAGAGALHRTATGWLILATWPLYLLVINFAPLYLGVFGPAYRDGALIVVVLAVAMLLGTGCGPVDVLLAMAGRTSWNLLNAGLALAAMLAVDLALIPRLGALGAAIGLTAAVAVDNLLPLARVTPALGLRPFGAAPTAAAALAAGCFGVLPAVAAATVGTGPAALLGALAASTTGYVLGARQLRRLLALDAFRPRRPGQPAQTARRSP